MGTSSFGSRVGGLGSFFSLAPGHGGCEKVPLGTLRRASEAEAREDIERSMVVAMTPPCLEEEDRSAASGGSQQARIKD